MVKVASSVTLEGIVATQFNADEGMKAAFAQSILDRSNGAFDEVIDIVAGWGSEAPRRRFGRRRLLHGRRPRRRHRGRSFGWCRFAGTGVGRLTAAVGDRSFLTTLQAADTAFAAVTVDVAATTSSIADAVLEVIVTTPGPTASPTTPQPTSGPTTTPGVLPAMARTAAAPSLSSSSPSLSCSPLLASLRTYTGRRRKGYGRHEGRARNEGIVVHGRSDRRRRGWRRRRSLGVADRTSSARSPGFYRRCPRSRRRRSACV